MQVTVFDTRLAVGSDVTLVLVGPQGHKSDLNDLLNKLWKYVFNFEKRFSRFLPNSELSQFNRSAGLKKPISPEFQAILAEAVRLSRTTEGLFDPFILPALQRAGYKKSMVPGYENDPQDDYSKHHVAEVDSLEVGDDWARIPYGTAIDLGGCGKGYLADRLRELAENDWVTGFWFSIGGDIAGGGLNEAGETWTVEIKDDPMQKTAAQWELHGAKAGFAVATSGTNIRRGSKGGRSWHHILDPRTQLPAKTDLTTATIYGNSTVEADVLASAAIILGSKAGLHMLKKQPSVKAALLQGKDQAGRTIAVTTGHAIRNRSTTRSKHA